MKKRQIFISYCNEDRLIARQLRDFVNEIFLGVHDLFLSEDLDAGEDWFAQISRCLSAKPITLVIVSHRALERPWVWFEVGASWNAGGTVVPICCRRMSKNELPDPLRRLQAVNLSTSGLEHLIATIAKLSDCTVADEQIRAAMRVRFEEFV